MTKIHTRVKRQFLLSTHKNHYGFFHPTQTPHRARTFSTEEAAKVWAREHKLEEFSIESAKKGKRFKIVS